MNRRAFMAIFMWVFCGVSVADDLALKNLDILAGASLEYQVAGSEKEYRLAKSGIKKANNIWRVDELKLTGQVTRNTYLLKESVAYQELESLLKEQINSNDTLKLVFKCQGLDCGSSSGWANHHFNIKQLYGLDVYQYYSAWESVSSDLSKIYHAFYLVQRGNKRVYLQHDTVSVTLQNPANFVSQNAPILEQLKKYSSVKVLTVPAAQLKGQESGSREHELVNSTNKVAVENIKQILSANAQLRLRIVGHRYNDATLEDRIRLSIDMAEHLKVALVSAGVSADKISTHGVGGLAPSGKAFDRVECILESTE